MTNPKKSLAKTKNKIKSEKYFNNVKRKFDNLDLTFNQYEKLSHVYQMNYLHNYFNKKNPLYNGHQIKGSCKTCLEITVFNLNGEVTDIE